MHKVRPAQQEHQLLTNSSDPGEPAKREWPIQSGQAIYTLRSVCLYTWDTYRPRQVRYATRCQQ